MNEMHAQALLEPYMEVIAFLDYFRSRVCVFHERRLYEDKFRNFIH